MKIIIIISLISSFLLFQCKRSKETSSELISAHQLKELLKQDSVQLVDVRTAEEFCEGHIKNAINIDFFSPDFDLKMAALDNSKPLILYCRSGRRSAKSVLKLSDKDYVFIYDLEGGIIQWIFEGNQIIK